MKNKLQINSFLNDKSSSATTTTTKSFLRPLPQCLLAVKKEPNNKSGKLRPQNETETEGE